LLIFIYIYIFFFGCRLSKTNCAILLLVESNFNHFFFNQCPNIGTIIAYGFRKSIVNSSCLIVSTFCEHSHKNHLFIFIYSTNENVTAFIAAFSKSICNLIFFTYILFAFFPFYFFHRFFFRCFFS